MQQRNLPGDYSRRNRTIDRLTTATAILMSVYHFVSAQKLLVFSDIHVAIHICFALVIVFLQKMKLDDRRHPVENSLLAALALASVGVTIFIAANYEAFKTSMGQNPPGKVLSGAILLAVLMIGTYITWGKTIPIIVLIALAYGYFGPYMPGFLYHGGLSLDRVITYSTTNFTGVFGMLGTISANTIVLFSIFAGLMQAFGALDAIMNVAMAASGKVRSGAAQVAVLSSGLVGSVTGSVAANISMTGAVSIPLMKKRGYPPEFAGACEAAASTGGAILPPVMNAAAFIIASWTSTPYIKIALIGVAPALLYYFGISLSIYIKAIKLGDKKNEDDALPHFKKAFLEFVIYIIPLIVLVVFLVKMYSPQVSLFYAILALLLVGLIQQVRGSGLAGCVRGFVRKTLDGLAIGSKSMAMIAVVMAIMGVVVQILTATGLPSKISQFVITLAGDNLFLLALFVAITCLIFGMGMPAAPAYILAALLGAPALTAFGVPLLAAHFFVFYYGELSAVTPPVAIGALVASGLAKGDFMKTSLISMRLAVCGFAIPFMFIFRPEILLMGTLWEFVWSILMVMVFAFACVIFFENFFLEKLILPERIGAAAAAFCCIWPHFAFDFVGLALIALVVASHLCRHRRAARAQGAEGPAA